MLDVHTGMKKMLLVDSLDILEPFSIPAFTNRPFKISLWTFKFDLKI